MTQCRLISGPAALSAQLLLLTIVLLSLLYKRNRETPRRSFTVWGMDVSKQLVSSAAAHVIAMAIAIVTQVYQVEDGSKATSECSWYFVIYCVDSTLGMALVLIAHEVVLKVVQAYLTRTSQHSSLGRDLEVLNSDTSALESGMSRRRSSMCGDTEGSYRWVLEYIVDCGDYGDPPDVYKWGVQLAQFSLCVIAARICCGVVVITGASVLATFAAALDSLFQGHPTALLFFCHGGLPSHDEHHPGSDSGSVLEVAIS